MFFAGSFVVQEVRKDRQELEKRFARDLEIERQRSQLAIDKAALDLKDAKRDIEKAFQDFQRETKEALEAQETAQQKTIESLNTYVTREAANATREFDKAQAVLDREREKLARFKEEVELLLEDVAKELAVVEAQSLESSGGKVDLLHALVRARVKLDVFLKDYRIAKLELEKKFERPEYISSPNGSLGSGASPIAEAGMPEIDTNALTTIDEVLAPLEKLKLAALTNTTVNDRIAAINPLSIFLFLLGSLGFLLLAGLVFGRPKTNATAPTLKPRRFRPGVQFPYLLIPTLE